MADVPTAEQSSAEGVVFRVLGPLEVSGPSGPVRIPPGRQETILAAMLLEANRVVSIDHLVDLIWDENPPSTARTQVQICVSRIRKELADSGVETAIDTRPPGYLMRLEPDELDLHLFGRHVAESRVLVGQGRTVEAAQLLRAAVGLWRGVCLSGIPSETLQAKGLRLDEDRLSAVEAYLELELALGRHHELVGEIGRLVLEHPLRERLRGRYMLALYRSGRQAEALDAYRAGRNLLIEELGLDPGEELQQLEAAILAGDPSLLVGTEVPAAPIVGAGAGASADVGVLLTRQTDPAQGTVPVAVLAHAGANSDGSAPPPRSTAPASTALLDAPGPVGPYRNEKAHLLPADTADFIGGEALVGQVREALASSAAHGATGVVVIIGKPGIGKSTAATHIGHRLAEERFEDGQLYCDLRGTGSEPVPPREVLGRFLRALGIPGSMVPDALDERAEMYRTILATRRVLVVLDDAATEGQVGPLLPGGGSCAVIITSRARLTGLPGARWIELSILSVDQALDLLGRVIGADRVDREREAATALARTVGGLPLALRIVAARLAARPHWSLASMVGRLADERHRLDELAHGEMTIRASLSLTHDGLGWTDRRLLRLLSLAQGPTLPGWLAGALLDDRRAQPSDLIETLVDVQMLDVVGVERTGEFRYRFHEIIRMFAREELEANDGEDVRQAATVRMIGGWLAILERAHRRIYGGDYTVLRGDAVRWLPPEHHVDGLLADPLEWMDGEQVNLCHAVSHAAAAGLDEACWELATTMVTLFEARGYHDLWESTHQEALVAVRRAGNKRGTGALLSSLGTLHISRLQETQARTALESALRLFDELGDTHGRALCWRDMALLERRRGDEERASALYERALRGFDQAGDIVGKATVLTQSAHIWMRQGNGGAAHARLEEALEIYRAAGYSGGEAKALRRVGQVLLQRGEPEQAQQTLTEVLGMVRSQGDVIGEAHLLVNLGEVSTHLGRYEQATSEYERALAIREQIMDTGGAALIRLELARLSMRAGEERKAVLWLENAVPVLRDRAMTRELQEAERLLGELGAGTTPDS